MTSESAVDIFAPNGRLANQLLQLILVALDLRRQFWDADAAANVGDVWKVVVGDKSTNRKHK